MDNAATRALLRSREGQPFLHVLMDHLNTALLNLWERNLVVSSYTIGDRVMTYLQMRSLAEGTKEIRLPGNLDGFAAYLGCARPALSRTLAGLIAEGKITRRGKGCYELLVTQPNTTLVKT